MIDRNHPLPVSRQAKALGISRGRVYYRPKPVSAADLALMRRIDELHLERPFAGSRMLRDLLNQARIAMGRKHVTTLMRRMGIQALYRKPQASGPHGLPVPAAWPDDRPAQLDLGDGPDLPPDGPGLRLPGCGDRLVQPPGPVMAGLDIAISMDGKGCWRDNVFIERLWKSVKYEEVYLRAYDSVSPARASLGRHFDFYNRRRPHTALDRLTPDQVYFNPPLPLPMAA